MRLSNLMQGVTEPINDRPAGDPDILGITQDSRRVRKGFLFVAVRGTGSAGSTEQDGHNFLSEAVKKGAVAVVVQGPKTGVAAPPAPLVSTGRTGSDGIRAASAGSSPSSVVSRPEDSRRFPASEESAVAKDSVLPVLPVLPVPQIQVGDSRKVLAELAARFYEEPSRRLGLFGVTGTNGKTTLTYLLESIFKEAGRLPGVVGTVNYRYGKVRESAPTTTPESVDLQRILSEMLSGGVTDVIMEVSSHALSQGRVQELHFDGAAFTNLSRDHLDYHKNLEDYFSAKLRLFTEFLPASCKEGKFTVVNMEDPRGEQVVGLSAGRKIRAGLTGPYEVVTSFYRLAPEGIEARIRFEEKEVRIASPLVGQFNLENILVAAAVAYGAGISPDEVAAGVAKVAGVPGRLEPVPNQRHLAVYVDYAHTPDALARVGQALKGFCPGRMITVFGCGGDRDHGKRPLMGEAAARFSDWLVVTSDNPRSEDPEKIIDEILAGLKGFGKIFRIPDRREALCKAVEIARPGDTVLVAGKGHEDYQILGTQKVRFSDQEVLKELLS